MQFPNGFQQLRRRSFLEEVPAGARAYRVEDRVAVAVNRQHQDGQFRHFLMDLPHALDARHAGKPDIREQDVGLGLPDSRKGLLHGTVLTRDLESRRAGN